jgi:hypothetical protein
VERAISDEVAGLDVADPALVDALVAALRRLGPVTVTERVTAVEDVHFTPPAIGDPS